MPGGRFAEVRTPLILSILMVLMTQVGYLDLMNAWSGDVETLDETNDVLETGGSGSASVYDNNKLTTGKDHACAVLGNGSAMCWGDDSYGQTGANGNGGSLHNLPAWVDLGAGRSAVAVGAGGRHTCVILDNGSLMCMGADNDGQVGDGASWPSNNHNKLTPVHVGLGSGRSAVAVAGGYDHTCAILDNGSLMCWGEDDHGQIGDNSFKIDAPSPALVDVGAGRTVTAVSGGEYHTCAVLDDGTVKCWGFDGYGQLGNGAASSSEVTTPPSATVNLGQGRTALTITAGQHHSCAILDDGSVKCWGSDSDGQLGDGGTTHTSTTKTTSPSTNPIDLGQGRTAVAISAGGAHTCAILDDGSVKCWGLNNNGQLGLGSSIGTIEPTPPTTPIDLGSGRTAVAIATGEYFTCATLDNGSLMCWGEDSSEQLGNGAGNSDEDEPIFVGGGHTWDNSTGLSSGSGSSNTLTASTDGASVLLGDTMVPITFEYDAAVVEPQLLSRNMAMGHRTSCAIVENGSVACWGWGFMGQLGDGGQGNAIVPTLTNSMPGNMKAVAIDASTSLVCAVLENGSVACWGSGSYGMLGNGIENNLVKPPGLTLPIGAEAIDVATRDDGACALLVNGSVSCWGRDNSGQLGSGLVNRSEGSSTQLSLSPNYTSPLPNGKKATAITAGYDHTCVLLEDGNVACWGSNNEGQLGLGNTSGDVSVPTLTLSLGAAATAIETDRKHTCALLVNGSVYCWGLNDRGQVGNGLYGQSSVHTPTFVQNLPSTVRSISTAYVHSCAILQNDSVYCWGDNTAGQLGKGTTSTAWTTSGNMPNATSSFASSNSKLMLDAGGDAGCALVNNGSIYCWGRNSHGNIGDGSGSTNVNANRIVSSPSLADTSMTFLTTHITELTSASACSTAPSLPTGLSIDSSTCTISGVPTAAVDNRTYNVTATVNGITFQTSIWLSTAYRTMTPSVDGADLSVGVDMQNITFDTGDIGSKTLAMTHRSTCAIIDNGTVKCWGDNNFGRLGNGISGSVGIYASDMGDALPVTNLGTNRTAKAISSAFIDHEIAHTCAVLDDGSVKCWGRNVNGQLGIGSTTTVGTDLDDMGDNLSAVDLGAGRTAVDVASGEAFTCAVLDDGSVKCWGINSFGQLGIGNTTQMGDHPGEMGDNLSSVDLGTGRTAVSITAGHEHACAILDNGSVKCWGKNIHGQLGIGSTTHMGDQSGEMGDALPFVSLAPGRTVAYIAAGNAHTCAILDNGSVKCWGYNSFGNLGIGTNQHMGDQTGEMGIHLPFVDLGTGRTAVDITGMIQSNCAVLDNGDVKCWGRNNHGQLGQGVSTAWVGHAANQMGDNLAVTNLGTGAAKAIAIGSGYTHACAVFDNGSIKCWGSNGNVPPATGPGGWLGFGSADNKVGNAASEMGDNLPFVNLGTNVGMNGTSFTSCVASPNLPTGVNIDSSTCVISGAPTLESTNQTYTVTGLKNGKYYQGSVWLSASYLELTPSVEGADLILDEAMTNITFQYNASAASGSGSGMTDVTGATACTASPNLPTGLNIDSSTCTISGTPTVEAVNATYEINATIGGVTYIGSVWLSAAPFGTITSAVEGAALNLGEAMTPIALNYTSQAPPGSSGNGTTWIPTPPAGIDPYAPRMADYFMLEHDDVIYFDAMMSNGKKAVYAFSTVNGTMWNTYDINSINSATNSQPYTGEYLAKFVGDDLFFTIKNGSGISVYELWVYSTSNGTTWRAMQQTASSYGFAMEFVIGDRLYFDESHSGSQTFKFGVYDTSNHTYWNHSTTILSPTVGSCGVPGANFHTTVGDTIYFDACDASQSYGNEMYAFNTINGSYWRTTDLDNGTNDSLPGKHMHIVIDDVIYFDAQVGTGAINTHALYAYNTSNGTSWLAADLRQPGYDMTPHSMDTAMPKREPVVIGDTLYFDAAASLYTARTSIGSTCTGGHKEIYAYNIDNETAWCVADAGGGGWSGSGHNSGAAHNMLHLIGDVLLFDAETGSTQGGTQTRTNSLWAHNLSNGSTWEITTKTTSSDIISEVGTGFAVFSIDNTLYFPARNNTVGMEVWGYDVVNETYWLVNDTCPGVFNGISGGSFHTLVHQGVFYSSVRISQNGLGEQHILGVFNPVPSSSTSSGGSGGGSSGGSSGVTWSTHPALPAGMSISAGVISGTPTVYALNQTYTIYANQSGYSTTHELYFSVDTDNAHTVVENQTIDPIGFHPPFSGGTTTWTVSPNLPSSLTNSSTTGEITGTVTSTTTNATYTVTATHSDGSVETFTFSLRSLADYDGDGSPNDLPSDYDAAEGPTPGLVADTDDDGDGLDDSVETDTGIYVDGTNTGTDPLNPDTDGDGICDGPNAVSNVCIAGPDSDPNGAGLPATLVAVNNTAITTLAPYFTLSGGTYEYEPDLPDGLVMDANTGELSGTPTTTTGNTTYTVWLNNTNNEKLSYTFTIEVLEDSDGDGDPNELPGDYDPTNPDAPGLSEDLDDDNDGLPDTNETETGSYVDESDTGTSPTNPDTDGDGMCDGPNAVSNVCSAGPDAFPHDPSADTDTDGDGQPDTIDGASPSVPPLVEDEDDDGDGLDDVNETGTGTYVNESDTGTDPLDPDTDNDGICDGPNAVPPICVAGPDLTPLGEAADGVVYLLNNTVMSSLTPQATGAGMTYEIWPDLPDGLNIDATSGIISGTPTKVITKTNFTVYGNGSGTPIVFSFFLQVLEDTDRDGEPNELPEDYPEDGDLIEDLDDDGDGASDLSETDTGIYNGADDLGTDSLNPDTDGDGICDGPNAVPPVCLAGPDSNPVGTGPFGPTVLVNNTEATPIQPPNSVPGATWELSPADLPDGLVFDSSTGVISGTPTVSMENRTYTIWANTTDPTFSVEATFWLQVLEDYDGDGMPDQLPDDYPDTGVEPYTLVEDEDDDNDGMSDADEGIVGTEPRNPDTDGDGFCDGGLGVEGVCFAGPDSDPLDPDLPVNTDGDAYPDDDPDGPGGLTADDDDDNDGFLDTLEIDCASDPLDADDGPDDLDGDGICDLMDDDMDGDGIPNDDELGLPLDTASNNADTDGDGVCDGPNAVSDVCSAGPDAFPLDPAGAKDTDNDEKPDQMVPGVDSTSDPPLVEDLDDDDDTWSDLDEIACGTSNPLDKASAPIDTDGDGECDALDPYLDLPFTLEYPTQYVDLFVNQTMEPLLPYINGSGEVVTWELEGELPEGLTFGWSPARDATMDGSIRGTPVNATETVNLTVWANNSYYQESFALSLTVFNDSDNDSLPDQLPEGYVGNLTEDTDDDNDGFSDSQESQCGSDPMDPESGDSEWLPICLSSGERETQDDGPNWMWCFPCLLILLLLLIIPLLLGRDRSPVMLADGPEPENTFAEPEFVSGSGTEEDPFVLAPLGPLQPGTMDSSVEEITITSMSDLSVEMIDYNDENNYGRFSMYESAFSMEGSRVLPVGKDGEIVLNFKFDDREFPTYEGGTYAARIKLGKASVHFLWEVTIMADDNKAEAEKKNTMARIKKRKKSFDFERIGKATKKNADDLQAIKGIGPYSEEKLNALGIFTYTQLANFDRQTEDDVNDAIEHYKGRIRRDEWVKQAQNIIGAQAKADEEALKAAEEAKAKAEAEAKAAEEAEAKKKAEEEAVAKAAEEEAAAAAAAAAAEKEAKEAEKKAKAEAKKAKAAEEKAAKEAEKKAKAEADKKAKEEAAAAAAAKKAEEEAKAKKKAEAEAKKARAAEEKAAKEAEKKAKAEADKKAKEEAAAAAAAKKAKEEAEAKKKAEADAKKKAAAKPATKEAKKEAELERVKSRAKTIDFKVLGQATSTKLKTEVKKGAKSLEVADASEFADAGTAALSDQKGTTTITWTGKDGNALTGVSGITRVFGKAAVVTSRDDLQVIKGIGPFIEEKLNALGITTYRQIANMNAKLEEQVNEAIEFFPGRVKRDQWANQAKILLGEDVKLDEKALKQAEELERVAAKAEKIDFATLGVASASEKDDLKTIKGIGPFIEEKLNALGIFTFEQVSKMTAKIEEEVNVAIEFFPGRVKRDEWAKQAKQLHKGKK